MYTFLVFVVLIKTIYCSRILCIFPTPFYSHQSVYQPVWRELSLRGHDVTVLTTNPLNDASLTNLTEIDLSFSYKLVFEDQNMQYVINTERSLLTLMKHVFFIMQNLTIEQLQREQVQKLIRSDDQFDLMFVEAHVPAWFGLVKKYNCPIIAVTSMDATTHFKQVMGTINNPILTPHINLPFDNDLTLIQRVICVIFEMFDGFQTNYLLYPVQQKIIRQTLNEPDLNLHEILKNNVSLMFTVVIPGFNKVTTNVLSIIQLNGLQIKTPEPLPAELYDFLEGATDGAIFISLGSSVKSYLLSEKQRSIFLEVLQELPFRVIWKLEKEFTDLPRNIRTVSWAPQQDILRHKNTKLFITQGGLQSIEESIRFKVPVLGIPFFGDQFHNVIRVKHLGLGSWIDSNDLTKEVFKSVVLAIINNETCLKNLEEISDLLDDPMTSLNKAIWWIEYVIRHKGAKHLRSPLADIPFYQYYLLDVLVFLLVFFFVTTMLTVKLVKVLWHKKTRNKIKLQ